MYYGWIEDRIWYLEKSNWYVFYELPWCLVTCIDSSRNIKNLIPTKKIIADGEESCSLLGDGLVVGNKRIIDVVRKYNLFNGFDEIWLYKNRPTIEKPEEVSIVSTLDLSKDKPSKKLLDWFEESDCVLGLGDGIGMNYITTSKEIERSLIEFD